MTDANNPDLNLTTNWTQSGEPNFDSENNVYLDTINDIERGYVKIGAYGADWSSVSLPSAPSDGKWCIRINTNDNNNARIYIYNANAWIYFGTTAVLTKINPVGVLTENGATEAGFDAHYYINFPSADADAQARWTFVLPDNLNGANAIDIKFQYFLLTSNTAYSVQVYVTALGDGQNRTTEANNVLNASTAHDFPASGTGIDTIETHTISLDDADINPGDTIGLRIQSDASNSSRLLIVAVWVEIP